MTDDLTRYLSVRAAWHLTAVEGIEPARAVAVSAAHYSVDPTWLYERLMEKRRGCEEARVRRDRITAAGQIAKQRREKASGSIAESEAIESLPAPARPILGLPGDVSNARDKSAEAEA